MQRFAKAIAVYALLLPMVACGEGGTTWPGFRGEGRDGHAATLPEKWAKPQLLWQFPLPSPGVGGVAATNDFVVLSGRDATDQDDLFVCLDPITGTQLWQLQYPAPADLDYGNSPRATPMIADPWVYLLGASGQLHCVDLDSGEVLWKRHLVDDLKGERPIWGYGGSPLLKGRHLIVQPGGTQFPIVALDTENGDLVWHGEAGQAAYASPQATKINGIDQIVSFDQNSLSGWNEADGKRLWTITPTGTREFHVPMPLIDDKGVITAGENRGTCRYRWDQEGRLSSTVHGQQFDLAPDMQSPVATAGQVIGVSDGLMAVDTANDMAIAWRINDAAFKRHCSLIVANDRLVVTTESGELLLVDISETGRDDEPNASDRILGRAMLGDTSARSLAHPALVGEVIYVRGLHSICAWSMTSKQ